MKFEIVQNTLLSDFIGLSSSKTLATMATWREDFSSLLFWGNNMAAVTSCENTLPPLKEADHEKPLLRHSVMRAMVSKNFKERSRLTGWKENLKRCIFCFALRHERYLTLLYVTSIRDLFCPLLYLAAALLVGNNNIINNNTHNSNNHNNYNNNTVDSR